MTWPSCFSLPLSTRLYSCSASLDRHWPRKKDANVIAGTSNTDSPDRVPRTRYAWSFPTAVSRWESCLFCLQCHSVRILNIHMIRKIKHCFNGIVLTFLRTEPQLHPILGKRMERKEGAPYSATKILNQWWIVYFVRYLEYLQVLFCYCRKPQL